MESINIDPEEFLLWIMKEKNNLNSEFQYYFQNLPLLANAPIAYWIMDVLLSFKEQ